MYTALYRAERPETFDQVLGQEHIVKILKHQIQTGTVSHAYLFCGTRGTGKTTMARILAKGLNCLEEESERPCGKCENCKAISSGTFMDVVEIDAASNNGVENIRELRESVKYPPTEGRKKVYVIDEVHMLSTGAFNALLKTLEEPPEYVVFILATTEPQKLPATILSRCMRLDFKRVPQHLLMKGMKRICNDRGIEITDGALKILANCADGSVRDGLSILDQVLAAGDKVIDRENVLEYIGTEGEDFFIELTDLVALRKTADALVLLAKALSDGKDVKTIMRDWMGHYRNLLMTKFIKKPEDILNMSTENVERVRQQSNHITSEEINSAILKLAKTINEARYSTQPRILLELAIVDIATGFLDDDVRTGERQARPIYASGIKNQSAAAKTAPAKTAPATVDAATADEKPKEEKNNSGDLAGSEGDTNTREAIQDTKPNETMADEKESWDLEALWKDACEMGSKREGSFSMYKERAYLDCVGDGDFTVVTISQAILKLLQSHSNTIEKVMEELLGRSMHMNCRLENQETNPEQKHIAEGTTSESKEKIAKSLKDAFGDMEFEIQ